MPDAAGTKNDGGTVFGSQIVTIKNRSAADQTYIAEAFSLEDGSQVTVTANEKGVPHKQFFRDTVPTGSLTLQLDSESTKLPKKYAEFTAEEIGGTEIDLIVTKVGQAFTHEGETKVTIDVSAKLA